MTFRSKLLKSAIFIPFSIPLLGFFLGLNFELNQINHLQNFLIGTRSPFPVAIAPLTYAGDLSMGKIIWLDNELILVPAFSHGSQTNADRLMRGSPGIYIWNTKTGDYNRYASLTSFPPILCYRNGLIVYSEGRSGQSKFHLKAWPSGEERPLNRFDDWWKQPEYVDCVNKESWMRPEHSNATTVSLQRGDGYLKLGMSKRSGHSSISKENQNELVLFYSPNRDDRTELPIRLKEMHFAKTTYFDYEKQYLIVPSMPADQPFNGKLTSWPANKPQPIYSITKDGLKEIIMLPSGLWQGAAVVAPTRKGLFVVSNTVPSGNSINAGGYLLVNGKMEKLYDHLTTSFGVSPNGCKIAFSTSDHDPSTKDFIKSINVCDKY